MQNLYFIWNLKLTLDVMWGMMMGFVVTFFPFLYRWTYIDRHKSSIIRFDCNVMIDLYDGMASC